MLLFISKVGLLIRAVIFFFLYAFKYQRFLSCCLIKENCFSLLADQSENNSFD